jgi:hypothetical protein
MYVVRFFLSQFGQCMSHLGTFRTCHDLRLESAMRGKADVRRTVPGAFVCPTGKSPGAPDRRPCPAHCAKIFRFSEIANHAYIIPYRVTEGAFRDRHERWLRDAVDARCALDEGTDARTAKSCGSDASTLASSSREAGFLRDDGDKKPDRREELEVNR